MSVEVLTAALEVSLRHASQDLAVESPDKHAEWVHFSAAITEPIAEALRATPETAVLEGQQYTLPTSRYVIDLSSAARYLVNRARRLSARVVAEDVLRLARERTVSYMEARLIEGLNIEHPALLSDGFSVVPIRDLAEAEHPAELLSTSNVPKHGFGAAPDSAVIHRQTLPLQLTPEPTSEGSWVSLVRITEEGDWEAALKALVLASNGAPQYRQGYNVITDPGWIGVACNGFTASETFPLPVEPATTFDASIASEVFAPLRAIQSVALALALNRLDSARRRLSPAEKAIDLGTCAEILLMGGSKDNAEISYKLATRAAWLLDGGGAARLSTFKAMQKLYGDRSTAAHRGTLGTSRDTAEVEALRQRLDASDELCAKLLVKLVRHGLPKDWCAVVLNASEQ